MIKLEPEVENFDPIFESILEALREDIPFIYTKVNHAFWERLVFLDRVGESYFEQNPEKAAEIDRMGRHTPALVETGFVKELFELYRQMPINNSNFVFSANLESLPYCGPLQGLPFEDEQLCHAKIQKYVPTILNRVKADGLEFKRAVINGRFTEFAATLKKKAFLLVANTDLKQFPNFIGANLANYYPIHGSQSRFERYELLHGLKRALKGMEGQRRVVIQAGGALSSWLAIHLYEWDPLISVFDIGNAMCICNPRAIFSRVFGLFYRTQILATIEHIHKGWYDQSVNYASNFADSGGFDQWACKTGRSGKIICNAKNWGAPVPQRIWDPAVPHTVPVAFIENKTVDHDRINDFLSLSIRQNHHANRGPVSRLLEECISIRLQLPPTRKVVVCSSCTAGIQIAAGVAAIKHGRPLRWVGSSFGFLSSHIGRLAGIKLIDCSERAELDFRALRQLPDHEWDGVLYTNAFGICTHLWRELRQFCCDRGKALIIDNAVGLLDRPNFKADTAEIEIISCHHTKPWGYGEGGIIIVQEEDEPLVRQLINFGALAPVAALPYAMNAKISDLACAAILDRLERMPHWGIFYHHQAMRIRKVIKKKRLPLKELQGGINRRSPTSNLPFLAEHEVRAEHLNNDHLVLRKYYRPLCTKDAIDAAGNPIQFTNAESIYQRIINIPSHPFVRILSDDQIADALAAVLARSSAKGALS